MGQNMENSTLEDSYSFFPTPKETFSEDGAADLSAKSLGKVAHFAHRGEFGPEKSDHPLCLVLDHNGEEILLIVGGQFDDSGLVETALCFDFHFGEVGYFYIEEGFGCELGLLDGFGLAVDHLEDLGHEKHLLEGVADGVGILEGTEVGLYKLDSSLVLQPYFRMLGGDGRLLNNFLCDLQLEILLVVHLLHFHHLKLRIIIGLIGIILHMHFLLGNLGLIHLLLIFNHLLVGNILFGHLHVLLCVHLLLSIDCLFLCIYLLLLGHHLLFLCVHLLLGYLSVNLLLGNLSVNLLLLDLLHLGLLHHHHLFFPLLFAQTLEHCLFG